MATATIWGLSQDSERITRGITRYSTASHGGYKVSKGLNLHIPTILRDQDGWYEEDCAYAIVHVFFSQFFSPEKVVSAHEVLERWYPREFSAYKAAGFNATLADASKSSYAKLWEFNYFKARQEKIGITYPDQDSWIDAFIAGGCKC